MAAGVKTTAIEQVQEAPRMQLGREVNYSIAAFGTTLISLFQVTFILLFYTQEVGLDAGKAGLALMIGRIWDAVTDPAMGSISDRTRWRMGRRRPYMLLGAIPLAISYISLWTPPTGWSQQGLFLYLFFTYIAYNTSITIVSIPYVALGGEMSMDYHERTRIVAIRQVFQTLGWYAASVGLMINQLLLDHAPNAGGLWHTLVTFRNGYAMTAVICGAVCTLGLVWTVFTVKEDPTLRTHHTIGHLRALWQTMKNRSFLILMLAFLLMSALNSMGFASFPYLIQYWYYSGDRAAMARNLPMLMLPMLLIALPGFAFWTRVSRRTGKRTACLYGFGALSVVTIINFYMFTPHIPWLYWPWAVLFGFVCALTNMIVPAMIPDIVDEDELETGARREGSFFGANTFALKLAGALGVWLAGLSLDAIGFQKGAATQPEMTVFWLRAFYAFVRGGGLVVTFLVMFAFPLTPERVAGIRSQLNARKARSSQEAGTLTA